jgi:hypothetical protein
MLARQIAIGFGIAVVFPMLIHYGVSTFFAAPKYSVMVTATSAGASPEERRANEAERRQQQAAYEAAAKAFARVLVIVAAPLGLLAMLIGAYLSLQAIGTGLIFGGISTVAWGYYCYWYYLDDWVRFLLLLIGFAVLLFIGVRRAASSTAGA